MNKSNFLTYRYRLTASLVVNFLCLLTLASFSSLGFGLESDKQQPVHIESSQAEADYKKGTTTYTGDVLLTQGSLKIQADQLIIYRGDQGVKSVIAKGLPARFQQQPFIDKPPVYANALTITYDLINEVLLLDGDVLIELDGSTHQGARYEYNLQTQMLNASGDGENRVVVTFDPMAVKPSVDQNLLPKKTNNTPNHQVNPKPDLKPVPSKP